MENRALLTVIALLLAGIVTIMLARSEGDAGENAFSGAAFERHKSVEPQAYPPRRAVLDASATSVGYSIGELGYSSEEDEASAPIGM